MCSQCDKVDRDFGAGSQASIVMKGQFHPESREKMAARNRAIAELHAAQVEAADAKDAAPANLEEAIGFLTDQHSLLTEDRCPTTCRVCAFLERMKR